MVGFPWSAYGVSQMYYYKKSMAENTKDGIKYDTVMQSLNYSKPYSLNDEDAMG